MTMVSRAVDKAYRDIRSMRVRGALDIAIYAAETLAGVVKATPGPTANIRKELARAGARLKESRPTAVSLPNAVDYVLYLGKQHKKLAEKDFRAAMAADIKAFVAEQKAALSKIAEYGSRLIKSGDDILTHCNSDTALQVIIAAHKQGKTINVVADETRPRNQGLLTVKALKKAGLKPTLIIDSACYYHMKALEIDKVIVGADAICANGDVVNKIGTAQVALAAKSLGIPVIVAAESIKFSPATVMGGLVEIEERDPKEVASIRGVTVKNPAFDVTPNEYVSMIVTEHGVMPPQAAYQLLKEKYAWEWAP